MKVGDLVRYSETGDIGIILSLDSFMIRASSRTKKVGGVCFSMPIWWWHKHTEVLSESR